MATAAQQAAAKAAEDAKAAAAAKKLAATDAANKIAAAKAAADAKIAARKIQSQQNQILTSMKAATKSADKNTAAAVAEKKDVIASNTKLSAQLGGSIDSKTGIITPPTGGYTPEKLLTAEENPVVRETLPGPALSSLDSTQLDAYALLKKAFRDYGLDDLVPVIEKYMADNTGPQEASLLLKQTQEYKTRFAGNYDPKNGRVNKGLNALSEAEYLTLENQYNETLNAYGLGNYFGVTPKEKQAGMASIIGGDVSAPEFQSRIKLVEDQVVNADPEIKKQLKNFYNINDTDLMKYYLNPTQNLNDLTIKTQSAQIGAAAANQGFTTSASSAMNLALNNVTQADAIKGYINIGQELPIASKLNQIYGKQSQGNYDQATAEAEQFNLKGAASAARKKRELQELEKAQFSGRSGIVEANVNAGYGGSLGTSVQGKF